MPPEQHEEQPRELCGFWVIFELPPDEFWLPLICREARPRFAECSSTSIRQRAM